MEIKSFYRFFVFCVQDKERVNNGDKLALISELFNLMIINFQYNYYYTCGQYMLVGFGARCRYKMPKNPNKYGLKIVSV